MEYPTQKTKSRRVVPGGVSAMSPGNRRTGDFLLVPRNKIRKQGLKKYKYGKMSVRTSLGGRVVCNLSVVCCCLSVKDRK